MREVSTYRLVVISHGALTARCIAVGGQRKLMVDWAKALWNANRYAAVSVIKCDARGVWSRAAW